MNTNNINSHENGRILRELASAQPGFAEYCNYYDIEGSAYLELGRVMEAKRDYTAVLGWYAYHQFAKC
ncbi:MAG: hypothetical protein LBU89_05845 [Fibromonadaceae bacterium]|jgi:hypothetical protein|nr:hypothetical protein [Fibromonadaceae bacterium]